MALGDRAGDETYSKVSECSPAQERFWRQDRLAGPGRYNVSMALRFTGHLVPEALEDSLREVVGRHEVLRTVLIEDRGRLLQCVSPNVDLVLRRHAVSAADDGQAELQRLLLELLERPLDLGRAPVCHADLVSVRDGHVLNLTMHHAVIDGWSRNVLLDELAAAYNARLRGSARPLPPVQKQYSDYVAEHRELLESGVRQRQAAYWRERLAGVEPLLPPTRFAQPRQRTYDGDLMLCNWPPPVGQLVWRVARETRTTPFMVLAASLVALLHAHTRQTDIRIGVPVAARRCATWARILGPIMNLVVLRIAVAGEESFELLLRRVRQRALEAYEHSDLPMAEVAQSIESERNSARPMFEVLLQYVRPTVPAFDGLKVSAVPFRARSSHHDISVVVLDEVDQWHAPWSVYLEYSTDLFDAAAIAALADDFEVITRKACDNRMLSVAELGGAVRQPQCS